MQIITGIIEMILRMILHIASCLTVPLPGTINVLLFFVLGTIGILGVNRRRSPVSAPIHISTRTCAAGAS